MLLIFCALLCQMPMENIVNLVEYFPAFILNRTGLCVASQGLVMLQTLSLFDLGGDNKSEHSTLAPLSARIICRSQSIQNKCLCLSSSPGLKRQTDGKVSENSPVNLSDTSSSPRPCECASCTLFRKLAAYQMMHMWSVIVNCEP